MNFPLQYRYLFNGHRELLTVDEANAWRNLQVERLIELCDYPAVRSLFRIRWISEDPAVIDLLKLGSEQFYKNTLQRLDSRTHHCPECHALCRTSRARLCPECSHTWFQK
ncbi:MAG: hypothetical protein ACI9FG_000068 [Crocinitomicaceae bacterium]|jgi:hypothetical protein